MKRIAVCLLAAGMILLSACSGSIKDRLRGTWRLDSVNGMTVAEYSKQSGIDISGLNISWIISGDTVTAKVGDSPLVEDKPIEYTDNGFKVEGDNATTTFTFNAEKDTLTYSGEVGGLRIVYTLTRDEVG